MTEREIVLSYRLLYHSTSAKLWPTIQSMGLQPTSAGYELTGCKGRPLICLSIPEKKHKWVSTLADKFDGDDIVILEIPAGVVAERDFALDETNTELRMLRERLQSPDFKTLLDAVGDLVCFNSIPASSIRLSETRSPNRSD